MERRKPARKAGPSSKRGIAWPRWTGLQGKTVWDLLQLLIVPLMLAAIGFWFTAQQDQRQTEIENQRAAAERELAEQRAQDEALQAYLDQMSTLLLEKDLRASDEDSEVRTLARARTVTVIQRLDAEHNSNVIGFLSEARLTGWGPSSISLLKGTDLQGAHLESVDLSGLDLSDADLGGANLSGAILVDTNLSGAYLAGADLSIPIGKHQQATQLQGANLSDAFLSRADLANVWLFDVDLSGANLEDTDLSNTDLSGANLTNAYLSGADLSGAELRYANLRYASGVTKEALEKQASHLEGTKMPTGKNITTVFEPAFAYSSADWGIPEPGEKVNQVILAHEAGGYDLIFTNVSHVFDPSNPSEPKEVPAPENAEV